MEQNKQFDRIDKWDLDKCNGRISGTIILKFGLYTIKP